MTGRPQPTDVLILREARRDHRFRGCDLRVLSAIAELPLRRDGSRTASYAEIGDELGLYRVTVQRSVGRLRELGYLDVERVVDDRRGQQASRYRLQLPVDQAELTLEDSSPAPTEEHHGWGGAPESPATPAPESSATPPRSRLATPHGESLPPNPDSSLRSVSGLPPQERDVRDRRVKRPAKRVPGQRELPMLGVVAAAGPAPGGVPANRDVPRLGQPRNLPTRHLPADWAPSPADRAFAEKRGLTAPEIDAEAERFVRFHRSRGKPSADWPAEWERQVDNAIERRKGGKDGTAIGGGAGGTGGDARERTSRLAQAFGALSRSRG